MKNNKLFKANLLIGLILVVGFLLTAVISYYAGRQMLFCWPAGIFCLLAGGMTGAILLIINTVIRRMNIQVTELLATTDEMTGLYSKKVTERLIKKQILEDGDGMYAFFIFDIDNFKQVNDTYGHLFGDYCICRFARAIRKGFGEEDIIGRIGGDEFVAFVRVTGREEAKTMAETFIRELNFVVRREKIGCNITASLGVCLYPEDGTSFEELYLGADKALYWTKQKGKRGYTLKNGMDETGGGAGDGHVGEAGAGDGRVGEAGAGDGHVALLQSQVQPHFLYNSLIGIKQLCDTDPGRASEALLHFCMYLRQNLESLSDAALIPFEKEMTHVREFFYLETMRFGDKLALETEILETGFLLPALTLQPLVENAVRHGILKKTGSGTVMVKTERRGEFIVITIADDGAGFNVGEPREDGRMHIGIPNVKKRLEIRCGGSMKIRSRKGEGTVVTITLPQRRNGF